MGHKARHRHPSRWAVFALLATAFWVPQQTVALSSDDDLTITTHSPLAASVDSTLEQAIVAAPSTSTAPEAVAPEAVAPAAASLPPASRWRVSGGADIDKEFKCLALNIYWEARSEPLQGKLAVAQVTLNRTEHRLFPDTICDVVFQGEKNGRHLCQFSWACDGLKDKPTNAAAWRHARNVAHKVLFQSPADPTNGALWYHATYVSPNWADPRHQIVQIGQHVFYGRVRMKHEMTKATRRS